MPVQPTFVFDDAGNAYAYLDGKIVAAASDADELEKKLAGPLDGLGDPAQVGDPHPPDLNVDPNFDPSGMQDQMGCPTCGGAGACPSCNGTGQASPDQAPPNEDSAISQADLPAASPDTLPGDNLPPRATHITTPSGLKGQIMGKVKDVWGEEVTVRLENGRITKFHVVPGEEYKYSNEVEEENLSEVDELRQKMDEMPDGTKSSLIARVNDLKKIKSKASSMIRAGANYADAQKLDQIVIQAEHELQDATNTLIDLEDAEAYAPPEPFQVAEQESLGGGDSSWLDNTLEEMIQEAESTDFDQMMEEAPETLVAELETPALMDADGVQATAASLVASKTAGIDPEAVADFRKAFLARVEELRVAEVENRQEEEDEDEETQIKEASTDDGNDEGLFW